MLFKEIILFTLTILPNPYTEIADFLTVKASGTYS
jgi:hypothetical protein